MTILQCAAGVSAIATATLYLHQAIRERPHNRTFSDYFFYGWSLRTGQIAASLFSSAMSFATVVVALLQLTGQFGIGLSYAMLTFCGGWLLIQKVAPRIHRRARPSETLHSFVGRFYESTAIQSGAALVTTIGLLGLFATELFAIDAIIRSLAVPQSWGVPLITTFGVFATIHASQGGFRTVVRSDIYQGALLLLSLLILLAIGVFIWYSAGLPPLEFKGQIKSLILPTPMLIGLFMINVPFPFVDTLTWQRLIASSSSGDYVRGSRRAVLGFSVTWTILVIIGLMVTTVDRSADCFAQLIQTTGAAPSLMTFALLFFLFPGLIAAMLSSSDAFLNSAAHTWCLDIAGYRRYGINDQVSEKASRHVIWLGTIGLIITLVLRLAGFNIVDMIFAVYAGTLSLFPCVLHSLIMDQGHTRPRLACGALISMFAGLIAAWAIGAMATVPFLRDNPITREVASLVPVDVYQAPTYAIVVSGAVYLLFVLFDTAVKKGLK